MRYDQSGEAVNQTRRRRIKKAVNRIIQHEHEKIPEGNEEIPEKILEEIPEEIEPENHRAIKHQRRRSSQDALRKLQTNARTRKTQKTLLALADQHQYLKSGEKAFQNLASNAQRKRLQRNSYLKGIYQNMDYGKQKGIDKLATNARRKIKQRELFEQGKSHHETREKQKAVDKLKVKKGGNKSDSDDDDDDDDDSGGGIKPTAKVADDVDVVDTQTGEEIPKSNDKVVASDFLYNVFGVRLNREQRRALNSATQDQKTSKEWMKFFINLLKTTGFGVVAGVGTLAIGQGLRKAGQLIGQGIGGIQGLIVEGQQVLINLGNGVTRRIGSFTDGTITLYNSISLRNLFPAINFPTTWWRPNIDLGIVVKGIRFVVSIALILGLLSIAGTIVTTHRPRASSSSSTTSSSSSTTARPKQRYSKPDAKWSRVKKRVDPANILTESRKRK